MFFLWIDDDGWEFDNSPHSKASRTLDVLGLLYEDFYGKFDEDEFFGWVERAIDQGDLMPQTSAQRWSDRLSSMLVDGVVSAQQEDLEAIFRGHMEVAIAFCVSAGKSASTDRDWGWACVVAATEFAGLAGSVASVRGDRLLRTSKLNDARHSENRNMKDMAREWYRMRRASGPISKDMAAELIAGKVVPAKFKTVRKWLTGVQA